MYLRTKHIYLPYHIFRFKVEALEIEVLYINTNDRLADQFTKVIQEGKFGLARKAIMKWYHLKVGYS